MADNRRLLRQAQVSERDVSTATARVAMDDLNGHVSGKMQVLFPAIGGWNMFFTPKEGDHVVTGNGQGEDYILGKVFTGNKMPQKGAKNIILLVSDDGKNVIRLDADKGTLDVVMDQNAGLMFNNLAIEVKETMTEKVKNKKTTAEKNIEEEAKENITSTAKKKNKIKGADVELDGNTKITGGYVECNGTASPTGTGCFCAKPFCTFDGSPHVGNKATGT